MKTQSPPSFQGPRVSISPWSPAPVESLKNCSTRPGVGAMRPMLNAGLPMLSSASANAFIWVISRVIRNCRASFVPASSQKLISRS